MHSREDNVLGELVTGLERHCEVCLIECLAVGLEKIERDSWCEGLSDQINVTEAGGTIDMSWAYIGSPRYSVVPWSSLAHRDCCGYMAQSPDKPSPNPIAAFFTAYYFSLALLLNTKMRSDAPSDRRTSQQPSKSSIALVRQEGESAWAAVKEEPMMDPTRARTSM